ncbi:hypothetical protein [Streptomyces sp. NPDC050164]|uniref:hypothetical protein n=1 Tax=Streptomyces sp. NPDC050164 TaxID=3365605 RepID=UPI0037AE31A3
MFYAVLDRERHPGTVTCDACVRVCDAAGRLSVPVKPLARLVVHPGDFPFLDQVHGHDDVLEARVAADPGGFPWFEEPGRASLRT